MFIPLRNLVILNIDNTMLYKAIFYRGMKISLISVKNDNNCFVKNKSNSKKENFDKKKALVLLHNFIQNLILRSLFYRPGNYNKFEKNITNQNLTWQKIKGKMRFCLDDNFNFVVVIIRYSMYSFQVKIYHY